MASYAKPENALKVGQAGNRLKTEYRLINSVPRSSSLSETRNKHLNTLSRSSHSRPTYRDATFRN